VSINYLRKLGLREALVSRGDGYLIDAEVPLLVVERDGSQKWLARRNGAPESTT
jgi:hypothetical protein